MKSRIIGFVCAALASFIFLYMLVLQIIGLVQSLSLTGKSLIIYSLLYILTALILVLTLCGIAAIAFDYCPKKFANGKQKYFLGIYIAVTAAILCIVVFWVYTVFSNYDTLQSLTAGNIIDENNVLPFYISQVKRNITMCWCNFGLTLFCFFIFGITVTTHRLRIKNGIDIHTR